MLGKRLVSSNVSAALTGPCPSSSRAQSCHFHLSYAERALGVSHTHSHTLPAPVVWHTLTLQRHEPRHIEPAQSLLLPARLLSLLSLCSSFGSNCLPQHPPPSPPHTHKWKVISLQRHSKQQSDCCPCKAYYLNKCPDLTKETTLDFTPVYISMCRGS